MPPNLDDLDDEIDDVKFEIPSGFPGSKKIRKPETIDLGENPVVKRKRGRPPGSGTNARKNPTEIQVWVVDVVATGYAFTAAIIAAQVFNNPKYKMTATEAKSAAAATVEVAFHYKEIRELATRFNPRSDYAILLKGFMPYLNRVFISEVLNYVISGLFVSKSGTKSAGTKPTSQPNSNNGNAAVGNESNGSNNQSPIPSINLSPEWRNDG